MEYKLSLISNKIDFLNQSEMNFVWRKLMLDKYWGRENSCSIR